MKELYRLGLTENYEYEKISNIIGIDFLQLCNYYEKEIVKIA